jgi:DNA-binding MarR family transcriptional regulator
MSDLIRAYQFRDRDRTYCHGISVTQCYALEGVIRGEPLTLNELARHLYLNKSTVSRVVDTMARKRLLTRTSHTDDRRAVQLRPTAKGRRLHRQIVKEVCERQERLIHDFSPEVRGHLIEFIRRLARSPRERVSGPKGECGGRRAKGPP